MEYLGLEVLIPMLLIGIVVGIIGRRFNQGIILLIGVIICAIAIITPFVAVFDTIAKPWLKDHPFLSIGIALIFIFGGRRLLKLWGD